MAKKPMTLKELKDFIIQIEESQPNMDISEIMIHAVITNGFTTTQAPIEVMSIGGNPENISCIFYGGTKVPGEE